MIKRTQLLSCAAIGVAALVIGSPAAVAKDAVVSESGIAIDGTVVSMTTAAKTTLHFNDGLVTFEISALQQQVRDPALTGVRLESGTFTMTLKPHGDDVTGLDAMAAFGGGGTAGVDDFSITRTFGSSDEIGLQAKLTRPDDTDATGSIGAARIAMMPGEVGDQAAESLFGITTDASQFWTGQIAYTEEIGTRADAPEQTGLTAGLVVTQLEVHGGSAIIGSGVLAESPMGVSFMSGFKSASNTTWSPLGTTTLEEANVRL